MKSSLPQTGTLSISAEGGENAEEKGSHGQPSDGARETIADELLVPTQRVPLPLRGQEPVE